MTTAIQPEPGDAVVLDEILEPLGPPLAEAGAKRLDMGIRLLADTVRGNVEKLAEKVTEAKQGQIHVALGFPSWTAYLADALGGQLELTSDARREVVALMAGEGMSLRAIACATGASKSTVGRDLAAIQVSQDGTPRDGTETDQPDATTPTPETVIGLDGKAQTRTKRKAGPRRDPFPVAFEHKADDVRKAVVKLVELMNGKRVSDAERCRLGVGLGYLDRAITALTKLREQFPAAAGTEGDEPGHIGTG